MNCTGKSELTKNLIRPIFSPVNNGAMSSTGTKLNSNNTLGAHVVEEKERWFYKWTGSYDMWNGYSYTPTKENEPGSSHTFTGDNSISKLTKTKHRGKSKTRIVSEVSITSIKQDFYIGKRQSIKLMTEDSFKPNIVTATAALTHKIRFRKRLNYYNTRLNSLMAH